MLGSICRRSVQFCWVVCLFCLRRLFSGIPNLINESDGIFPFCQWLLSQSEGRGWMVGRVMTGRFSWFGRHFHHLSCFQFAMRPTQSDKLYVDPKWSITAGDMWWVGQNCYSPKRAQWTICVSSNRIGLNWNRTRPGIVPATKVAQSLIIDLQIGSNRKHRNHQKQHIQVIQQRYTARNDCWRQ